MVEVAERTLEDYKGKTVSIVLDEHPEEAKEYVVEEATPLAYILREKGKSKQELYLADRIVSWEPPAPKPPAPLKAKRLGELTADKAKRHLLDFHAYTLSDVNKLSDKDALEFHGTIDHEALDLGHYHKKTEREAAIEAASAGVEPEDFEPEGGEDIEGTGDEIDSVF